MKSLEELAAIKAQMREKMIAREGMNSRRVVVGMATCGIAAGARPVLNAFLEEIDKAGLSDSITVTQTGCIGMCQFEPIVEVYESDKEKVTYILMNAEKAKKVVEEHLKNGKIVTEYTVNSVNV